jgi:hypothetical protein
MTGQMADMMGNSVLTLITLWNVAISDNMSKIAG